MRRFAFDNPVPNLNLLPFLDLVFAVIGILIVVFALQEAATRASGRQLAIDDLVICVAEGEVKLYAGPAAEPVRYAARQFPVLFAALAERPEAGVCNLVFALTGTCFETRRKFEEEFARVTALLHDQGERSDATRGLLPPACAARVIAKAEEWLTERF